VLLIGQLALLGFIAVGVATAAVTYIRKFRSAPRARLDDLGPYGDIIYGGRPEAPLPESTYSNEADIDPTGGRRSPDD